MACEMRIYLWLKSLSVLDIFGPANWIATGRRWRHKSRRSHKAYISRSSRSQSERKMQSMNARSLSFSRTNTCTRPSRPRPDRLNIFSTIFFLLIFSLFPINAVHNFLPLSLPPPLSVLVLGSALKIDRPTDSGGWQRWENRKIDGTRRFQGRSIMHNYWHLLSFAAVSRQSERP